MTGSELGEEKVWDLQTKAVPVNEPTMDRVRTPVLEELTPPLKLLPEPSACSPLLSDAASEASEKLNAARPSDSIKAIFDETGSNKSSPSTLDMCLVFLNNMAYN